MTAEALNHINQMITMILNRTVFFVRMLIKKNLVKLDFNFLLGISQ